MTAWAEDIGTVNYPLLSDFWPHGEVARRYGVLRENEGITERAIFIVDKEGIIRYIDVHEFNDQPSNQELLAEIRKIDPESAKTSLKNEPESVELPQGGIVVYCSSWCPDCRRARAWLKARNLSYTEVDVYKNATAAQQVRKWSDGNLTTPTFDINGTIIVDMDAEKLEKVLG